MKRYICASKRTLADELGRRSSYFDVDLVNALKAYDSGQFAGVADEIGHVLEDMIAKRYANHYIKWDLEDLESDYNLPYDSNWPGTRGGIYIHSLYHDPKTDRLLVLCKSTIGIYPMGYGYIVYENGSVCCDRVPSSDVGRRGQIRVWHY